jgi:hypothetical protein
MVWDLTHETLACGHVCSYSMVMTNSTTKATENQIWNLCRAAAKETLRLRRAGQLTAAGRIEQDTLRTVRRLRGAK